jgi:hypothetical protein
MTAKMTRSCAKVHTIFNVASHDGDANKALCTSASHFNVGLHNSDNDKPRAQAHAISMSRHTTATMTARKWLQQHHMSTTSPWCNSTQAVSYPGLRNSNNNKKNVNNVIVFHIALHNGNNDNNNGNSCIALRDGNNNNGNNNDKCQ